MRVATVLLALLVPATASAVEVGWSAGTAVSGTSEAGAVGLATGDLDRDGKPDLVWANTTGDSLRVGLGSGAGTFAATTVAAPDGPTDVILADVDGDGDTDIVYAAVDDGEFAWLANDGAGGTWTKSLVGLETEATTLAVADLDSDGDLDLVGGSWTGGNVVWFENMDGAGGAWSASRVIDATLGQVAEVAVADVNGDGALDIVASGFLAGVVRLYTGDGAGGFTSSTVDASSPGASGLAFADLDRDGTLDLVHAQTQGQTLVWYANDGSWTKNTIAASAPGARGVHLADLDHDGDVDVLLSLNGVGGGANQVRWYENGDGVGGTWGAQTIDSNLAGTNRSLAADFDGDGDLDIVATGFLANEVRYYANPLVHGSTHSWQQDTTSAGDSDPRHTTVVDIDGDGFLDFVGGGNQGIIVGINDGAGDFTPTVLDSAQHYWATAAGDLDGDGDIDVFGAGRSGTTQWFENLGGTFAAGVVIATGTGDGRDAHIADIDGDGDLDIAWAESEQNDLVVYFNDGGATSFTELDVDETLIGAFSVEILDFDSDGDMDLLAVGQQDDDVLWYENDGTSTTQGSWTQRIIATPTDPRSAAQGDVDGDGDRDVVTITTATNTPTIELYTNAGDDVTWTTTAIDSGLPNGWHIELADLDRDGDLDILASTGDDVRIYANDGSGGFGAAQIAGTGSNILHGGIGDFDGDGDLDGLFPHLSGTDKWTLYLNDWAQAELVATDLAPATKVFGSQEVLVQQWELSHLGRADDGTLYFPDMTVTFADALGTPLTTSELGSVIASIDMYMDDGDMSFSSASDLLMESDTTPSASASGSVSLSFTIEGSAAPTASTLFWVVIQTEATAPYAGVPTLVMTGPTDAFVYDDDLFLESLVHFEPATSTIEIAQAPVAHAGGPYSGDEGVAVGVDASGSSDTDGTIVSWAWDCDNDGTYETPGETAACTFGDDGTYTIGLDITDDDGLDATTTATVTVANVAPSVSISGAATADEAGSATYTATASDVADDPLSLQWFVSPPAGGTTPGGTATTESITFTEDGTWTLTVTADDGDGGTTSDTFTVAVANLAPTITTSATSTAVEGTAWTYLPAATDPGGDPLSWSVNAAAPGAMLVDAGTGALFWVPTLADAGTVTFVLTVDDGDGGTDTETITITVAFLDADNDALPDTWETANGLDPTADDAAADPDADGVSNLDEYLAGTDPNSYDGPSVPVPEAPIGSAEVTTATPVLSWFASTDPQGDALTYEVELYDVPSLAILLDSASNLTGTDWTPTVAVAENAAGYWRVRAADGNVSSGWSNLEPFVVNATEEAPSVPAPAAPLTGDSVDTLTPELSWSAATDPDADPVTYEVRLWDATGTTVVESAAGLTDTAWTPTTALTDNTAYQWDVEASDDEGLVSGFSSPQSFFVDLANDAPADIAWVAPLQDDALVDPAPVLEVTASSDVEGDALTYVFELDLVDSYDSPELLGFGAGTNTWDLDADSLSLTENVTWFARARVEDDRGGASAWAEISFFVRGENDSPAAPVLVAPDDGTTLEDGEVPTLVAGHVEDPEGDAVTYGFRVARDEAFVEIVEEVSDLPAEAGAEGTADQTSWTPTEPLPAGTYWWTASATDDGGASIEAEAAWSFVVEAPPGDDDDDATGDDDDDDETPGCDCASSVAPTGSGAGWLLLLPLALLRRRRP